MKGLLGRLVGRSAEAPAGGAAPPTAPTVPAATAGSPPPPTGADEAGGEARRIDLRELRSIVSDADELRKGTEVFDKGGLARLARHGERLFAEAAGSGSSPYRVTITIPAGARPTARCTCFAARTRPFCKHAAGLLVAWARAPESFVVAEAPPAADPAAGTGSGMRRATVRASRAATAELHTAGVAQAIALVRELAAAGVATAAVDRPEQIRALADTLRANRLRRLGARVHELAGLLESATRRRGSLDALAYATVVSDLLLTARRLERHLAGETLEDRHVEELIGRNWRKGDRTTTDGLELLQYAYLTRTTADDFVIRERRLIDLRSGTHYSEKQILPAMIARRTAPLPNEPDVKLAGSAGIYPGFAPHRLDPDGLAPAGSIAPDDVRRIVETSLPGPAAALAAFQDHRRDVFAPDTLPIAIRADAVVALGDRLAIVGAEGDAMLLAEGGTLVETIEGRRLETVIGDVDLDGILAVLRPLAVVAGGSRDLRLIPVPADSAPVEDEATGPDWLTSARAAGASPPALSLAEIRDELAVVLANGLGSLTDRVADPLATRLNDLGLERPSALLRELAARSDPADRLDDLVRLLQVLAIGAVRLAGSRKVERGALVAVPGHPALLAPDPGPPLPAEEVARRRSSGTMGWPEAAIHRARRLAELEPEALRPILPWWTDASALEAVVGASVGAPGVRERIQQALALRFGHDSLTWGLTAALAAIAILERTPDAWAGDMLDAVQAMPDPPRPRWPDARLPIPQRALRVAARRAAAGRSGRPPWTPAHAKVELTTVIEALGSARGRDRRRDAAQALAALEDPRAIPALRRSFRTDQAPVVQGEAAWSLASLGDTSMVDPFIDALARRDRDPEVAKGAAYALGLLGDIRGVEALVDALAEGWKTAVVLEALKRSSQPVLDVIIRRALAEPALAARRGFVSALEAIPAKAVLGALQEALAADPPPNAKQQVAILKLSAAHKPVAQDSARAILALPDAAADATARRAAEAVLNPRAKARPTA